MLDTSIKNAPFYPEFDNLFFGMLKIIQLFNGKEFAELENSAMLAFSKNDKVAAQNYAIAAAYYFGAPGLILCAQVMAKDLKDRIENNGEVVEQAVFNAMTYLFLAEQLLQKDNKSHLMEEKRMTSSKYLDRKYFTVIQNELLSLWELSRDEILECQKTAGDIAVRCFH
jgi:hypothetical protein